MKKNIIINILIVIFFTVLIANSQKILLYLNIKSSQNSINKYEEYPQKDAVNIVAITDSRFIEPTRVAIYSAIKNKNKNSKYNFYIIGISLNDEDVKTLKKQSTKDTPIVVIRNNNIYDFFDLKIVMSTHVPNVDFFKFNISDIFPNFDKILYIDGDIIVQKDLSDLYKMNLGDKYVAAVQENYKEFGLGDKLHLKKYFNNGVMLLNLKKFREENVPDKMFLYRIFISPKRFVTQDTFNVILKSKVMYIDSTYNTIIQDVDATKYKDLNKFLKSRAIIHYAGPIKPWDNPEDLYASNWEKYNEELKRQDEKQ